MAQQLMLMEPSREELLTRRIDMLEAKYKNLVRSLHAKNGTVYKEVIELKHDHEVLKLAICKGKIYV